MASKREKSHVPSISEYSLTHRLRLPHILTLANLQKEDRVLEIGSGSGYFIGRIAKDVDFTVGIDYNRQNNLRASAHWRSTAFVTGGAINLPFKEKSFNKIICSEVIEHIEDDLALIEEAYRVLKTNGILVITTPNLKPTFGFYKFFKKLAGITEWDIGHDREGYSEQQINRMLIGSKFVVQKMYTVNFLFPTLVRSITYLSRRILSRKIIEREGWGGAEIENIEKSRLFAVYKNLFPLVTAIAKIDSIFCPFAKGHTIVIKARKK